VFSLGSINYLVSEMNFFFFICPACSGGHLRFPKDKNKLFKRVKYDIFLQNNMFIPRVVSEKILKLQHQKELVIEAMLNFWIKWKTCNVENHPCNISTMFGSNWDRNLCSVHEEITSIRLYTLCNPRSSLRKGVYSLIEVISNEPNK
jgi:hypothetical protein